MTLEYRAPFQIDPYAQTRSQKSLANLGDTLSGVGQEALQYKQRQIDNARQASMMQLKQQEDARAQAEAARQASAFGPQSIPGSNGSSMTSPISQYPPAGGGASMPSAQGASPAGGTTTGTSGPQPTSDYSGSSGLTPAPVNTSSSSVPPPTQGPEPEGSVDYSQGQSGPQPQGYIDHTSHFMNWKAMGMPATYDHPDYGGTGQAIGMRQNPMQPQASPSFDQNSFMSMNQPQRQAYLQSQEEQRKIREEADRYSTGGANSLYSSPEQAAFQMAPNDPDKQKALIAKLNQLYPSGKIPKSAITATGSGLHFDINQGEHADQFADKRFSLLGDALDPSKQKGGAFGTSKGIFDRAERLETLGNAYKSGNLDSRQVEELAIGLNSMLQGGNVGAAEQVKALVPSTIIGNGAKIAEWLTNAPQGTNQQAFVQRMLGSVSREKQTAADQIKRTQFQRIGRYADLESKNKDQFENTLQSAGVDPDEYRTWKKGGYKPMSAVQNPGDTGGAKQPRADGKIMVSNGKQSFWIDPANAADAAKDGYQ